MFCKKFLNTNPFENNLCCRNFNINFMVVKQQFGPQFLSLTKTVKARDLWQLFQIVQIGYN